MPPKFNKTKVSTQLGNENYSKEDDDNQLSEYTITLNPNVSTTQGTPYHKLVHDKIYKKTEEIFEHESGYKKLIIFHNRPNDTYKKNIISIEPGHLTVEYDKNHHKWHLQGVLYIRHNSQVLLNIPYLKSEYAKTLNIDINSIKCKIRARRDPEDYALKGVKK